ncbi:MAG: F0F1 ATP synthase subunit A [Nocardioidaceae bacterium]|nr:F0F1 ATP synthase subunit A [Nocardioidaceae bacterium]MCL2613518.1 F0F1 ATP synthase subunit A [Nocardioidaceae bacterium]
MTPLIEITPGVHPEWHLFGMTLNRDTIVCTVIAGVIVVVMGLVLRSRLTKATDHVPTKLQLIWETIVDQVNTQVEDNLGHIHPFVAPLAIALFFFILIANWLEMIPSQINQHHSEFFVAPTADTNLTYALAIVVILSVWTYGIRQRGVKGYFSHFIGQSIFPEKPGADVPIRIVFTFLNVLEELIKPVTLALRLFGNIFAGGIMLALIGGLVAWKFGDVPVGGVLAIVFNIVWKLFDMAIGVIQAFIFALLTVLYFSMAGSGHGDDEHAAEHA